MGVSSPIPRPSRRFSKRASDACGGPVTEVARIADDTHALSDLVPADGRVSWVAPGLGGYEPYNEYLVVTNERALLIDTGVALHGPSILERLIPLVGNRHLVFISRGSSSIASAISRCCST